jgi:hypothetical protein
MKMKHCRPQCEAITTKGEPCKMTAARGGRLCEYHDPRLGPARHERNRQAAQRYWQAYGAMKALAESGIAKVVRIPAVCVMSLMPIGR